VEFQGLTLRHRFPGTAGKLQDAGEKLALIRELGDNYGTYHDTLRQAWADGGKRPEPADYEGRFAEFQAANQAQNEILEAERALRLCTLLRQGSKQYDDVFAVPVVDGAEGLYDFRKGPTDGPAPAPAPTWSPANHSGPSAPPQATPATGRDTATPAGRIR
jgi:hypothetical protein